MIYLWVLFSWNFSFMFRTSWKPRGYWWRSFSFENGTSYWEDYFYFYFFKI